MTSIPIDEEGMADLVNTGTRLPAPMRAKWLRLALPDAAMSPEADLVVVNDSPCLRTAKVLPTVSDTTSWRRFVGTYELHDPLISGRTVLISLEDDTLFLSRGRQKCRCLPLDTHHFACDEGLFAFRESEQGTLLELWQTMIARRKAPDQSFLLREPEGGR